MFMRKFLLAALLVGAANVAMAQTVTFGPYDELEEWGDYSGFEAYDGSAWECVPFNFYYTNSGTQLLYLKDELADMAGKDITAIAFKWYCEGAYIIPNPHVTVYITETNQNAFYKNPDTGCYRYFDVSRTEKAFEDDIEFDGYFYDCFVGDEKVITLSRPFHYSGENNLVITILGEGIDECTSGGFYMNFFATDLKNRALTAASDTKPLSEILAGDLYSEKNSVSTINMPVHQLSYEDGTAPDWTWTSYVPKFDEDLNINGFEAYKVKGFSTDGSAALVERVLSAKAGEPLVLRYKVEASVALSESAKAQEDNILQVSDGTVTGNGTVYALSKSDGVVAFRKVANGVTVPEGKVYLVSEQNVNDQIAFDGSTNSIAGVENAQPTDGAWYTISGQRVSQPTRGLYIHNGKKVVK